MRRMRGLAIILLLLAGCGDDGAASRDGGTDTGRADAGPLWPRDLPPTAELGGPRRGLTVARSIIHLHSPLSHDACDDQADLEEAVGSTDCMATLRDALCTTRVDVAMITDHAPYMNEVPFERVLWPDPADELITSTTGSTIASRMTCPNGQVVLLTVGSENALMPVGLRHHVLEGADAATLETAYDADGPAAVSAFHDAGALVLVNHTEERTVENLRGLGVDGIEIYNLHANIDPTSRRDYLGLDDYGFVTELFYFLERRRYLAPDLLFLAFFEISDAYFERWDTLLAEGQRIVGVAGTDAHQNSFPDEMWDGERIDSYRRMIRWFSNHLLLDGDPNPDNVAEALGMGRFYMAFEAFGSPVGFDFVADDAGTIVEMGGEATVGTTLRVLRPHIAPGQPQEPAPAITVRLLRSAAGGPVEVASGTDAMLELVTTEPGAYRAEARMVPEHTRPYLPGRADELIREVVWVESNPIHVIAPP